MLHFQQAIMERFDGIYFHIQVKKAADNTSLLMNKCTHFICCIVALFIGSTWSIEDNRPLVSEERCDGIKNTPP